MENKQPGKIQKILSTASIVGLFLTVGLLVTGITQGFLNAITCLILSIFTIVFAGCIMSLVWINNIENKKYFKTSIAFLAFTALCCVLWIVAAILIFVIYTKSKSTPDYNPLGLLNFVKIAIIISIQFVVANIIARNIIKYKKTYIAFQIIMYISGLFIDFYVTMFALGITFTKNDGILFNPAIRSFLFSGAMITLLILFAIYIAIANSVLKGIQTKRNGGTTVRKKRSLLGTLVDNLENGEFDEILPTFTQDTQTTIEESQTTIEEPQPVAETKGNENQVQDRLLKLKELYDSNLITEEEYNKKRSEILEEM